MGLSCSVDCCSATLPFHREPLHPPTNILLCEKTRLSWHDLAPGVPDSFPPMKPLRRLYFLLWTMFMVFTGMMFVMVSQFFLTYHTCVSALCCRPCGQSFLVLLGLHGRTNVLDFYHRSANSMATNKAHHRQADALRNDIVIFCAFVLSCRGCSPISAWVHARTRECESFSIPIEDALEMLGATFSLPARSSVKDTHAPPFDIIVIAGSAQHPGRPDPGRSAVFLVQPVRGLPHQPRQGPRRLAVCLLPEPSALRRGGELRQNSSEEQAEESEEWESAFSH